MKKVVWNAVARVAIVAVTLSSVSCGELTRQGQAASYLIMSALEAAPGATPEEFGSVLSSDVVTVVDGAQTFFGDNGRVTLRLALKDPGPPASPNTPTINNAITVNRYRITYIRTDGRNTPGVDVPYPVDGAVTFTVRGDPVSAGFTLVRSQAKLEAPLAALARSLVVISTIAEVTFYGHDQTGREVSVSGRIDIHFANFGDPAGGGGGGGD